MHPISIISNAAARLQGRAHAARVRLWPKASRLFLAGDNAAWSLDEDMKAVAGIAGRLGVRIGAPLDFPLSRGQAVFYSSSCALLTDAWRRHTHRVGLAYWHGQPGQGIPDFDRPFDELRAHHSRISVVQVSHRAMRDVVLSSGIDREKVCLIPIGINLDWFTVQTQERREQTRRRLHLPADAFVVGSFQKDGCGWGEGLEPKRVKGPDIFLRVVERLKASIPPLHVLLSGPARGYVKTGLERLGIPYRHVFVRDYMEVGGLYQALDLYVVASREEGGPKAVLESMASGVPLVTTRVGQAMDLVKHGRNGWMVGVDDVDGLVQWSEYVREHRSAIEPVIREGRRTAESNSYVAQTSLWKPLLGRLVQRGS